MGSVEEWHFEHDDVECGKCLEGNIETYLGRINGREAHKYVCTECGHEEIEYLDEMKPTV